MRQFSEDHAQVAQAVLAQRGIQVDAATVLEAIQAADQNRSRDRNHWITEAQQRCLDAIKRFKATHGQSPTITELASELGIGRSATYNMMLRLEERGHLTRLPGRQRSLTVT